LVSAINDGLTPLHAAADHVHVGVIRDLLKNNPQLGSVNKYGNTPLYIAAMNGQLDVV